jgi:hypothetical protein
LRNRAILPTGNCRPAFCDREIDLDPFVFPLPPPPAADPPVELILLSPALLLFPLPPPTPAETLPHLLTLLLQILPLPPSLLPSLTNSRPPNYYLQSPKVLLAKAFKEHTKPDLVHKQTHTHTHTHSRNENKNTKGNSKDQATATKIATSTESGRKRNRRWQMIHSKEETARE